MSHFIGNRNSTPEASGSTLRPPPQRASMGPGHHLRASADMGAFAVPQPNRNIRPSSEIFYNPMQQNQNLGVQEDSVDRASQQWIADIDQYQNTLEEMAAATLDQDFKDELNAIEQWFCVLSEAERTAALYALLRQTTPIQIRFFIGVLQQMSKSQQVPSALSPANFNERDPMANRLSTAMNKINGDTARNSMGPSRGPPGGSKRLSTLDPDEINSMFPDAAAAIAKQKAEFTTHVGAVTHSNRNSMHLGDRSSLLPPTISGPHEDLSQDAFSQPLPSPWGLRPSDAQQSGHRPRSSQGGQQPMGQFSQPPLSAGLRSPRPMGDMQSTTLNAPDNSALGMSLFSPYVPGASWASMVNTPMNATFSTQQSASQADMVANATAMKLAALSTVNNRIQLDDVRKYRRARSSDNPTGGPAPAPGMQTAALPANFIMTNENGQILTPQQVAALQAQQLAAINGRRSPSPSINLQGPGYTGNMSQVGNGYLNAYDSGLPSLNAMNGGMAGLNLGGYGGGFGNEGYLSDASEINRGRSPRGKRGSSRPPEDPADIELLKDIPGWLRSLRLHKYTDNLKEMRWQDMIMLDEDGLEKRGVNALGARRKLVKVFEDVRKQQGL